MDAAGTALRDRYEILSKLGEGGFATVLKARQVATGQPVAIKVLRLSRNGDGAADEKRLARFQREMFLCAQLHHPNIVRLIDSGHSGDVAYTVFEFVPGKDLAQVIAEERRLEPNEAKHLMLQVLDGLACAHALGVVHRDLKPANVMISPTGARRNALVLDFGIGAMTDEARQLDQARITLSNESIGTPSYAAPEQLGEHSPTPRSDLYGWGLVFLECLTGKRVVEGGTAAEVMYRQLSPEPVPIPAWIAEHPLGDLLRRVTVKDPAARNVTAEGLLRELEACDVSELRPRTGPVRMQPSAPNAATETVQVQSSQRGSDSKRRGDSERRQITAVCCTLGATSAGSKAADPEELDQILGQLQETSIGLARRSGGHVAGALGETLLFYFGYPTAREDDARRAARAALGLVAEVRARSAALQSEREVRVEVHIGIHTGVVVARELRDQTLGGLGYVAGATQRRAAHLAGLAPAGAILLSGETQRLLRKDFAIEAVATSNGGATAPETYQLHEGGPASPLDDVALVGRDREIETLVERWRRAGSGSGQAVLIGGEAGIGKSRLARELGRRIEGDAHLWLECRCLPDGANTAFRPVVDLLDRMLDPSRELPPESRVEQLEALLARHGFELSETMPLFGPLLSFKLPERWPALDISPQKQRELTRNALLSLLFEMADRTPVVLLLEDLHWADPSTLELLSHFVSDVASSSVLALFTARPELVPTWSHAAVHALHLGRFGPADVARMAAEIAGGRALPAGVLAQIVSRADGVPLFVEELVRATIESGALIESGDGYALSRPLAALAIPASLRDSLAARLDRLGRAKETAQVAAAIGREFTFELLRAVSPHGESAAQEDLDRLIAADLVYRKRRLKNPVFLFKHALVRDAAYDSMLGRAQREVHARIARAIEQSLPDVASERPELLAHHHAAAEQKREAIGYGRRAALAALARSAFAEAVQHASIAIGWLDAITDPRERTLTELELNGLLTMALTARSGFAAPEVTRAVERSQVLLDAAGDGPHTVQALWSLFMYHHLQGVRATARARDVAERLLAFAGRTEDTAAETLALALLGQALFAEGRFVEARAYLERAMVLHDPIEPPSDAARFGIDSRAYAAMTLATVVWILGYPDRALRLCDVAVARAEASNHRQSVLTALIFFAALRRWQGEREATAALIDRVLEGAQRHGFGMLLVYAQIYRGWVERSSEACEKGLGALSESGQDADSDGWNALIADVEIEAGAWDRALARLDGSLQNSTEAWRGYFDAHLLRLKAACLVGRDPSAAPEAESTLRAAIAIAQQQGARMFELQAATALAKLLHERGAATEARALLGPVYDGFTEGFDTPVLLEARRWLRL